MKFFKKAGKKAEVLIYEDIGNSLVGDGMTAKVFTRELKALGDVDEINVRINSIGGDSWQAVAIYNALVRHPATIVVDIDGVAASAASYIAMAASSGKLRMAANADFMIHRAWAWHVGDADDMHKMGGRLEDLDNNQLDVYGTRASVSREKLEKMLDDETWFTAKEAQAAGLIDEITGELKVAAMASDYSKFTNMPPHVAARFTNGGRSMSQTIDDSQAKIDAAVKAAVEPLQGQHAAVIERLKADHAAKLSALKDPPYKDVDKTEPTPDEIRATERTRTKELTALFTNAGLKDGAVLDRWIDKGQSLLEAKGEIADIAIKHNKLIADEGGEPGEDSGDPHAKFRQEYREQREMLQRIDPRISEDAFIRSRCRDEGLPVPAMAAK